MNILCKQLNDFIKYKITLCVVLALVLILQLPKIQANDKTIEEKFKQEVSKFDKLIKKKLKQFKRYKKKSSNKTSYKKLVSNVKKNYKNNIDIFKQNKNSNYLGLSSLILKRGAIENLKFSINITNSAQFEEYQTFITDLINLYLENKFEQAFNLVNRLIAEIPQNTFFLNLKSAILYELELYDLSQGVLFDILELDLKNASALNNLAILYAIEDDYDMAIQFIKKALQIQTNNPLIKKNLQEIYLIKKNYKKFFELEVPK